jgi:hypothetical protein
VVVEYFVTWLKKRSKWLAVVVLLVLVATAVSVVAAKRHNENKKRQITETVEVLKANAAKSSAFIDTANKYTFLLLEHPEMSGTDVNIFLFAVSWADMDRVHNEGIEKLIELGAMKPDLSIKECSERLTELGVYERE